MHNSSSSVRHRGQRNGSQTHRHSHTIENHQGGKQERKKEVLTQKQGALFFFVYFSVTFFVVYYSVYYLPKPKSLSDAKTTEFTEEGARKHLHSFVSLGHRPAGSVANDVDAANYIVNSVSQIKAKASPFVKIELETQRPTGSFTIDFIGGFASYYANITNTLVRVSPVDKSSHHALLLNCHTDSVNGAPGASDDAIACAVLLEVMRAIAVDRTHPLLHDIIFLFNGAEENVLQGSHGFITQHPWAKRVKAFINLEAAGAGGKEIVFQTGPSNPWLALAWATHAPHPFGTIFAQELFQSGIIPSDTDFRIFRDYGKVPGIDLAYMKNGYVYHTWYDNVDMILPGCIQRAGDNILAVVNHLVKSPFSLLPDPGSYRHGAIAFTDFLGIFMMTVPLRMLSIMNFIFSVGPLIYLLRRIIFQSEERPQYGKQIIKGAATIVSSWVACILTVLLLAIFITKFGNSMAFYSRPYLVVFLYGFPGLAVLLIAHLIAASTIFKNEDPWRLETIFFDSYLFIWSTFLFQLNYLQLQSSLIILLCVMPLCLIRCVFLKQVFGFNSNVSAVVKVSICFTVLIPHTIILFSHSWVSMELFIPLCGRLGTDVPPDLVIGLLTALSLIFVFHFSLSLIHAVKSIRWILALMVLLSLGAVCFSISSYGFPYAVTNDIVAPKRLYVQHTSRTFYGFDKKITLEDSGIWLNTMDFPGFKIDIGSKAVKESPLIPCRGLFCHFPFVLPVNKIVKTSKYIPADRPSFQEIKVKPFSVKLLEHKVTKILENSTSRTYKKRLLFAVDGPSHMTVHIAPLSSEGVSSSLTRWIVNDNIDHSRSHPTSITPTLVWGNIHYEYSDWHFLYYGSGLHKETWKPWFEFTITQDSNLPPYDHSLAPTVELAIMGHYYSTERKIPVPAQTHDLKNFLDDLHDWVVPMSWVSVYENHLF
ncbi:endoplasmic reticulum metallopeptidase 1-like isoform X2 [Clavelina lepadiformis]